MLIVHYGLPKKILSDQGRNFESHLVANLFKLMGIQKLHTSPYHPQTNDQCERFNSTLIGVLGMLPPREEIRVEEPHWGISPCLQLYPEFSYRVQPLLPHVWKATHLPVDVTLGLAPQSVTAPTISKFMHKM